MNRVYYLLKVYIKCLTFVHVLLSPQFLAEDYSLEDVLYYVTRDDLKCLRLRYHSFLYVPFSWWKERWAEKSGILSCLAGPLPSPYHLSGPGAHSVVHICSA